MRKRNQSIIIIRFVLFPIMACAPLSLKINKKKIEGYYCIIESGKSPYVLWRLNENDKLST